MSLDPSLGTHHVTHEVRGAPVCYLTKRFPRLSETFILDEILGLEAEGINLRLVSIGDPGEAHVQPRVAKVASPVRYLRRTSASRLSADEFARMARSHARLLIKHPWRWARVAARVLAHPTPGTARHFLEAGPMAEIMSSLGATHVHAAFAHGPASIARNASDLLGGTYSLSAHAKDLYLSRPRALAAKVAGARFALTCSQSASEALRRIVAQHPRRRVADAQHKVLYAPHGVDVEEFHPLEDESRGALSATGPTRILAVGRLVPKKGYPVLVAALSLLKEAGVDFTCRIVGEGSLGDEIAALLAEAGLDERVSLVGAMTHDEVRAEYHAADVFVQASVVTSDGDRDGIPNSVLEAMASALAVVGSDVSGIPEVVIDERTGLLVPAGEPAALAGALARLCREPEERRRLGDGARRHVRANLSRAECVRTVADLLFTLGRPATPPTPGFGR